MKSIPLTPQQIEHMEELVDRVRASSGLDIQGLTAVFKSDLFQRKRWTAGTYNRFVAWCAKDHDIHVPLGEPKPLGSGLFQINLAESDVSEQDIFDTASEEFEGPYLLFTWVGTTNARITWIELKRQSGPSTSPSFEAHRGDGIVFYGMYYVFEGSLFLFGHKNLSPMSRTWSLERNRFAASLYRRPPRLHVRP